MPITLPSHMSYIATTYVADSTESASNGKGSIPDGRPLMMYERTRRDLAQLFEVDNAKEGERLPMQLKPFQVPPEETHRIQRPNEQETTIIRSDPEEAEEVCLGELECPAHPQERSRSTGGQKRK